MSRVQNLDLKINAKPLDLVEALKRNKAKHLNQYAAACKVYFEELESQFAKLIAKVRNGDLSVNYDVRLKRPINNEKLYDKYIGMLELATDETITLSSEDYGCIVDDKWDWAVSASETNLDYAFRHA